MKILIEGTEKEIEMAKATLKSTCLFDSEFCKPNKSCDECEREQNLIKEFNIKS